MFIVVETNDLKFSLNYGCYVFTLSFFLSLLV